MSYKLCGSDSVNLRHGLGLGAHGISRGPESRGFSKGDTQESYCELTFKVDSLNCSKFLHGSSHSELKGPYFGLIPSGLI